MVYLARIRVDERWAGVGQCKSRYRKRTRADTGRRMWMSSCLTSYLVQCDWKIQAREKRDAKAVHETGEERRTVNRHACAGIRLWCSDMINIPQASFAGKKSHHRLHSSVHLCD